MSRKSIKKYKQKQAYREHLDKINDDGFRHYHCPSCFNNDKILVEGKYTEIGWVCDRCNNKWIMVA
jgi:ribosomal protein L37AE/L43A